LVDIRAAREMDLAAVVAVMNAVDVATLGEPDTTETDIATGWQEPQFDLARDAFVATDGGEVVGYSEVYDRGDDRVELEIDVFVHPAHPDPTTAAALLDHALARAHNITEAGRVTTWLPVDDPRTVAFTDAGFAPRRHFVRMRRSTSDPLEAAPPRDVEVRPLLPGVDERAVHGVLVEAFMTHVRPITASYERFEQQHVHHPDYDPELWALAWAGDQPVGAITVFDHGDLGFIRHVGVLPNWRGRGVATALIAYGLDGLAQRGQDRVDLGVDVDDPVGALRLYERLGFRQLQDLVLYERPV